MNSHAYKGIDQKIIRRDFLQGLAIGLGSLSLRCKTSGLFNEDSMNNTSNTKRLSGQSSSAQELGHFVRDGKHRGKPYLNTHRQTDSHYDLIVVGAGLSGLSAALTFQSEHGHRAKVLILDNNESLFGHARINKFHYEGNHYIAPGGAYALEYPEQSPKEVLDFFSQIGLNLEILKSYREEQFFSHYKLSSALLLDPRKLQVSSLSWMKDFHKRSYRDLFYETSLPHKLKVDLTEFYESRKDYLPGIENKEAYLKSISWTHFICEHMQLDREVCKFANIYATDLCGLGSDAISAWDGFLIGPGFYGMGGEGFYEDQNGVLKYGYNPKHRFPDGNFSIGKLILNKLLPTALGSNVYSMDQVFNSSINYSILDNDNEKTKIRLNMMVTKVAHSHGSNKQKVWVEYRNKSGEKFEASADHVILSSWGMVNKHIVPELTAEQKQALDSYMYTSAVYINILLKNWRPIAEIGAFDMYLPDGYCTWMSISDPLTIPPYAPKYDPNSPTILSMYKYLYDPQLPPKAQMKLGRLKMESKSFWDYELEVRRELDYLFGPYGFNSVKDIAGIMINRWAHGYNFFKSASQDRNAFSIGKRTLGKISFAGADAAGDPWAQSAISEGIRAAKEQLKQ